MRKRAVLISVAIAVVAIAATTILLLRQRQPRHRLFRHFVARTAAPKSIPPVEQWTQTFEQLSAADLDDLLDRIEAQHPDLYSRWSLGYLHARAKLERNDASGAARKLAPYLAARNPFRDLALYHQSEIADAEGDHSAASRARQELIFSTHSMYREQSIDEEVEFLSGLSNSTALLAFASRLEPAAPTPRKRELEARVAAALERSGNPAASSTRALAILRAGTMDDAAELAARVIDRPDIVHRLARPDLILLGETMQNHRHFDRAVALLSAAVGTPPPPATKAALIEGNHARARDEKSHSPAISKHPAAAHAKPGAAHAKPGAAHAKPGSPHPKPAPAAVAAHTAASPGRDELLFAIGRSWFGAEHYAEAQQTYLRGASETHDPKWKSTFLFHASRAAQLRGDDAGAEHLLTSAISIPGTFESSKAALVQRLRLHLREKRIADANADLAAARRLGPNDHTVVDASLAYAIAMVASGSSGNAVAALNSVPPHLLDKMGEAEFAYWRARAVEQRDPHAAFISYLTVLRSPVPTHYAYFARARLDSAAMKPRLVQELAQRDAEIVRFVQSKDFVKAKEAATDRALLSTIDRPHVLQQLAGIYRQLPEYRTILELHPAAFPTLPTTSADRTTLLLAAGLFDEAAEEVPGRWPLHPLQSALTQSLALNHGGASKPSIYAVEVLMKSVPSDFLPDLLPTAVRQLLYPRYFYGAVLDDSKKFGCDPALVLAIMREESRFDPRAKSEAAARGLLQFIITTARDIAREVGLVDVTEDDLYDPRVIIRLGARYIATLSQTFAADDYKVAAAYNAGPRQVALWSRLAPADGDDYFLASINFDETKDYVRKVMNSWRRYGEIYGNTGPQGGLRAEP